MKTDLFVWGRPDEGANGQPFVRVRSRAVNGAGELEEEGEGMTSPHSSSNHYGNSVVRMYREVGAYCIAPYNASQGACDQETGYMWGVCNTPLPYRQERGTQKQKRMD